MKKKSTLLCLSLVATVAALALSSLPPASSAARQTERRGLVVARAEDGREIRLYEKSYALVVGVSDYTGGWPKLPGVKDDIEAVARALERQGFLVTKVENPDSAQLDKSFKAFIDAYGMGVENRLLFYFAGHGHTVKQSYGDEMGYIVPADAPLPTRDAAGFMSKAMDMQQMELYARRIQSKHALFLFDSCFSGALFALSRAVPENISYKTARPVRQFITSGSADERVPDQSIFRRQFVEAIEGEADANHDGYITGTEVGEFLQDKVVNYSRNAQHPQYGKIRNPNLDKGDFVFVAGNAPRPPAAAAVAPTPTTPASPAAVDRAVLELAFWDAVRNSNDPEDFKEYLEKYPAGQFAGIARRRLAAMTEAALTETAQKPDAANAAPGVNASPASSPPTPSAELPFRYNSPEGRYTILLPSRPKVNNVDIHPAPGHKLVQTQVLAMDGETAYMISHYEYPASFTYSSDAIRDATVKRVRGRLLLESALSLGGISGREWRIAGYADSGAEVVLRMRWYNTGRRIYLVQIVAVKASESMAYSEKAAKFFDSFQITNEP